MTARPRGRDDSGQARRRLVNAGVVWSISRTTRATTRGPGTDRRQVARQRQINGAPGRCGGRAHESRARGAGTRGRSARAGVSPSGALTAAGARARPRARRAGSHPSPRGPECAGDRHRADHRAERHRRATTRVVVAAEQRLEVGEVALDLRAVGLLRLPTDARHVRAQGRHAAPARRVVAVRGGHVGVGECGQRVLGAGRDLDQPRLAVGQRALDGFGDQLVARAEVLVEAAVGEPGGAHDLRHARLLGPRLADARRGDLDDPLVAGCLVLLGVPHRNLDDSDHPSMLG